MFRSLYQGALLLSALSFFGCAAAATASPGPSGPGTSLTIAASQVSGVAPLGVFFDTTASPRYSDGSYIDGTFVWNFGDSSSSHPLGNGFVAAHVFESPGTYTVTLDVYDRGGEHTTQTLSIEVTAFTGTTYYVSNAGSDTANDGLSEAAPLKTVNKALGKVLSSGASGIKNNVRLLFHRGETFPVTLTTATPLVQVAGAPITYQTAKSGFIDKYDTKGTIIMAPYGPATDPKPIITTAAVNSDYFMLQIGSGWRIVDLAFQGGGQTSGRQQNNIQQTDRYPGGISFGYGTKSLLLRVDQSYLGNMLLDVQGQYNIQADGEAHHFTVGGYTSDGNPPGSMVNDSNALIGNNEHDVFDDGNYQHGFRIQGGTRFYVAHNTFANLLPNYDNLTIRGTANRIVVYKNTIYGHMTIKPQNDNLPAERQDHVVVDSNLFIGSDKYHDQALGIKARDIVVRNNLFSNYATQIDVGSHNAAGPSSRVRIYHNSALGNDGTSKTDPTGNWPYLKFLSVDAASTDVHLRNNVLWDYSNLKTDFRKFIEVAGATVLSGSSDYNAISGDAWDAGWPTTKYYTFPMQDTADYKSSTLEKWRASGNDVHTVTADPGYTTTDPANAGFGKVPGTSPLKGKGQGGTAYVDYFGTLRSFTTPTIGAFELP